MSDQHDLAFGGNKRKVLSGAGPHDLTAFNRCVIHFIGVTTVSAITSADDYDGDDGNLAGTEFPAGSFLFGNTDSITLDASGLAVAYGN